MNHYVLLFVLFLNDLKCFPYLKKNVLLNIWELSTFFLSCATNDLCVCVRPKRGLSLGTVFPGRGLRGGNPVYEARPSEHQAVRQRVPTHPGQGRVGSHHGVRPGCEILQREGRGRGTRELSNSEITPVLRNYSLHTVSHTCI